ncbi:MAG: pyridoxamine kinase [Oscillospiraceae bacterium]|nr:pyridoxamine kinase [Oscillospiraceae bacterium]
MHEQKRIIAIHDMSGFGRCSLTVILPVLSAMGIQVCPVPTAVLATHTGGFGEAVMQDLTDFIPKCLEKYKALEIGFNAVYSGFLASSAQIDHCLDFFKSYPDSLKVADPVMGDDGKVYSTYTKELVRRMSELAHAADVITPNLTEAAILLNDEYKAVLTAEEAGDKLERLMKITETVVITGVALTDNTVVNIGGNPDGRWLVKCDYVPQNYPGTGDLFTAVLTGGLLKGKNLPDSVSMATAFTQEAVKLTFNRKTLPRNGVFFEEILHLLPADNFFSKYIQF